MHLIQLGDLKEKTGAHGANRDPDLKLIYLNKGMIASVSIGEDAEISELS